jgi:hypothetical protein
MAKTSNSKKATSEKKFNKLAESKGKEWGSNPAWIQCAIVWAWSLKGVIDDGNLKGYTA